LDFEVEALLAQSKNENAEVRLNTEFQAVQIYFASLIVRYRL
jgi:hypothetical protein